MHNIPTESVYCSVCEFVNLDCFVVSGLRDMFSSAPTCISLGYLLVVRTGAAATYFGWYVAAPPSHAPANHTP
jgi:hypothetical protein